MKLTVVDIENDHLFNEADFKLMNQFEKVQILKLPDQEPLDGSIYRALSSETTHLITRIVDRLGIEELAVLRELRFVGLAFSGWWDKYFDATALKNRGIIVANNLITP